MPETRPYRCLNCGKKFKEVVLTEEEAREARRRGRPLGSLHCPDCNRTAIEPGWG